MSMRNVSLLYLMEGRNLNVAILYNTLAPLLKYPYYPLHLLLCQLALRPGFLSACERWRERESLLEPGIYGDIYDGSVWKQVSKDYLTAPYSLMLSLNVDRFQPFKHLQYSVGGI